MMDETNDISNFEDFIAKEIEEQIDDTQLDICSKGILVALKTLQQNDIKNILSRFGNINSIYVWKMSTLIPIINSLNDAETDWKRDASGVPVDYNYLTHLNPSYKNQATKIGITRTILHEMIHAYLISLVDDAILTGSNDVTNFPLLWNSLVNNTYNNNPNQLQHEIIVPLRDALKEWDGAQQSNQYYEDLAWGALANTSTFNTLFPIGSASRIRIQDRIWAEQLNVTFGTTEPSGEPCD